MMSFKTNNIDGILSWCLPDDYSKKDYYNYRKAKRQSIFKL